MPSPPTLIDVSVTPRFAGAGRPVVPAAWRSWSRCGRRSARAAVDRRRREQHRRRDDADARSRSRRAAAGHARPPRSTGRSVLSSSWISTAHRWNTSGVAAGGIVDVFPRLEHDSSRWSEATRSASVPGGAGQIAGEALQGAGARRRLGMAPPHVLDVLTAPSPARRRRRSRSAVRELTAAVAVGPRAEPRRWRRGCASSSACPRPRACRGCSTTSAGTCSARIAPAITDRAALPVHNVTRWGIGRSLESAACGPTRAAPYCGHDRRRTSRREPLPHPARLARLLAQLQLRAAPRPGEHRARPAAREQRRHRARRAAASRTHSPPRHGDRHLGARRRARAPRQHRHRRRDLSRPRAAHERGQRHPATPR